MNLQEYLRSIGIKPLSERSDDCCEQSNDDNLCEEEKEESLRSIGDIFDYYTSKGYKELPGNVRINADNWEGHNHKTKRNETD